MPQCPRCAREIPPGKVCPRCVLGFVVEEAEPPMSENEFINLAIQKKAVSFEQIDECRRDKGEAPIWEALLQHGLLTQSQVDALLAGKDPVKAFTFGPYSIIAKLGEGGMGTVYKASRDGRVVALKVLPERFSKSEHVQRFEREAKIAIALSHPNLVKGYERGQINSRWYYAMEFVQGKSLAKLIEERGRLQEQAAVQIAIQIAGALETIRRAGLVHRDVKPDNIVMGEDGVAKLMDLGLVKSTVAEQTALTQSGHAIGTLHYMAPEQARGNEADARSDIYSLGATLYHLITGKKPFDVGTSPMEIMRATMAGRLEDPRKHNSNLSDGFCRVLSKMMARDPGDRFQNALDLEQDLRRVLSGHEPEARIATSRPSRAIRPAAATVPSRRPLVFAMVGLAIASGVGVIAIVATSGPGKPPVEPVKPPPTADPTAEIERRFTEHLAAGRLGVAASVVEREAGQLSGSKVLQMRKALEEAASDRFHAAEKAAAEREAAGEFDEARRILREFRDEAQAVAGIPEKVDARLARVDEAQQRAVASRNAPDPRREAEMRFRPLEDSIRALEANREYDRAIGILEGARTMAEDNPILVAMIDERIGMLRGLAAKAVVKPPPPTTPKETPDQLYQRALAKFDAGDLGGVDPILWYLFRDAPNDSRGHALAAHSMLRRGNKMAATGSAVRALQLNPADPRANLVLGLLRAEEGKHEEAVTRLDTALAAEPGWTEGRLARARACVALKKWDLALKDLEQLSDAPPTLKIDALEGAGKLPEAIEACDAWTQQPASLLRRAALHLRLKENDKARADYEKALEVDPSSEEAKAALAKLRPAAVKPPEVKKPLKPSEIKKKLAEYFNAKSENFVIRRDEKVLAQLWYDWSKPEQLQDFAAEAFAHEKRQLVLQGGANKVGGIALRARLSGEWSVKVDVTLTGAVGQTNGWGVRTANSLLPGAAPGEYAGAGVYQDPAGWKLVAASVGRKDAPPPQSKSVTLQPGSMVTLVLSREGSKFKATYGSGIVVELEADGMDPSYLRIYSVVPLRIDRLDIQAILDPDWVTSIVDPPDPTQSLPGVYEAGQIKATVESVDGQLKMTIPGQNPYPLKKLEGMKYELEGGKGWTAEFTIEVGRAKSVTLTPPPGTGQPATLNRVEK